MTSSILTSLGAGSGIDTQALIDSLTKAVHDPKDALIAKRETANKASVSALASISSGIDSFASALTGLVAGGSLFSQPSVSDASVLTASAVAGTRLGALSAQIHVDSLALAQTLVSAPLGAATAPVGQGDLTLTTAAGSFTVTIGAGNDSLDGLAKAINATASGLKASIVSDQGQARLVLKGGTGAAQAFTLAVPAGTTSGLERFAFGAGVSAGMSAAQDAADAVLTLDGVRVTRASNSFSDLIDGVQINLKSASAPASTVSLGVVRPTAAITQAMSDFVAAYNELHKTLADATAAATQAGGNSGPLRGDLSTRALQRQLARLPTQILNSTGGFSTLAEIGVATNRDGTLSVNATRLQSALASDPEGVEKLFNPVQYSSDPLVQVTSRIGAAAPGTYQLTDLVAAPSGGNASGKIGGLAMLASGPNLVAPAGSAAVGLVVKMLGAASSATITIDPGLGGALQAIRDAVRARSGPIAQSQQQLDKQAAAIAKDRTDMEAKVQGYHDRLVTSFAAMDKQVSAFKATQSYLTQQVAAWNNGNK